MSDKIPDFKLNDKVRIMQTDEMVKKGIANLRGRIIGFNPDNDEAMVQIVYNVSRNSLEKVDKI